MNKIVEYKIVDFHYKLDGTIRFFLHGPDEISEIKSAKTKCHLCCFQHFKVDCLNSNCHPYNRQDKEDVIFREITEDESSEIITYSH